MSAALEIAPTPAPTTLREVLRDRRVTVPELAAIVGLAERSAYRWLSGGTSPTGAGRARLAAWLAPIRLEDIRVSDDVTDLAAVRAERAASITREAAGAAVEERPMEISSREYLDPEELAWFNLADDPFDDVLDPEDVWMGGQLAAVEGVLKRAVARRTIVALVGDPGAGKSTLLRRLYALYAREDRVRLIAPATLDRSRMTHASLAVAILRDLVGRDTSSMSMETRDVLLRDTLAEQVKAGLFPVLLIDEAHKLKDDALIALKHLWDSHTLYRQLSIVLIGQLPLRDRLRANPALREVTGRTRILELPKLGDDVRGYLQFRFRKAGVDADQVFEPTAYKALALRAEHPLWVNNKAVLAMRYARSVGDETVTGDHVARG